MLLVLLVYSTRAVGAADQQAHVLLTNSTRTLDQQHACCWCCWSIVEDQRCAPLITTLWFPIGRRRKKRTSSAGSYSWHRPALASHPQTPQCPARCEHHPRGFLSTSLHCLPRCICSRSRLHQTSAGQVCVCARVLKDGKHWRLQPQQHECTRIKDICSL